MITGVTDTLPAIIFGVLGLALLVAYAVAWYRIITKAGFSGRWFLLPIGALVISAVASGVAARSVHTSTSSVHLVSGSGIVYTISQPATYGVAFYVGSVVATLMVLSIIAMFFAFAFMPWPIQKLNRYPLAAPDSFRPVPAPGVPTAPGPPARQRTGTPARSPLAADPAAAPARRHGAAAARRWPPMPRRGSRRASRSPLTPRLVFRPESRSLLDPPLCRARRLRRRSPQRCLRCRDRLLQLVRRGAARRALERAARVRPEGSAAVVLHAMRRQPEPGCRGGANCGTPSSEVSRR